MRFAFRKISFIFIFLFLNFLGKAQYHCVFEHLSTDDGLSHGSVSNMMKDSRGFMWFATWDGINRYDGLNFKIYKPGENGRNVLVSNRIETMEEDPHGNIWVINYDSKAFRFDRLAEKFEPVPYINEDSVQVNVKGFYFSPSGDVWLMTNEDGVFCVNTDTLTNRFSIQQFSEKSKPALPGNGIRFVFEDPYKNIWINTGKGIARYRKDNTSNELTVLDFPVKVKTLFESHEPTCYYISSKLICIGTVDGSLLVYNCSDGGIKDVHFRNNSAITNLSGDTTGNVFAGTRGNGIFEYNTLKNLPGKHYIFPEIANVLKTYPDSKGMLWVESDKPGISKIDLQNGRFRHYTQKLDVNPDIRSSAQCGLMEDEDKTLWLTLKGGGFGFYNKDADELEYFYNEPGNPECRVSNFVNCFYKDPDGVLWMSTYFKGIEKVTFVQQNFHFTQPVPGSDLSIANEVRALMEDSKGYLWVATKNQELFLLDKEFNVVNRIINYNGNPIGRVYALMEASDGYIYIGTKGNGLFVLDRESNFNFKVTHYKHSPDEIFSLSNNNIYALLNDSKGRIWIGTYGGGLNLFENGRFIHAGNEMKNYPQGKGAKVRHIAEDHLGNIWAGTTDGILFLSHESNSFNFDFFSNLTGNVKGLNSNDIFWIYPGKDKSIWMASLGGGLSKLITHPERGQSINFQTLTIEDGLPSDMIFTITGDPGGNLWMATENGIANYNITNKVFKNYSRYDGILSSGFSEAACATRADGTVCMGAYKGLYSFQSKDFTSISKKVDIVFTDFRLFGKSISPGNNSILNVSITGAKRISLKYNQNVFGITWAGLDFKLQDKFRYAYKLEGYDDEWRYSQGQNFASYSKIPPGEYTFLVRFENPELQQLNQPASIAIVVKPPLWKTTVAYLLYLILAIAFIELARRTITTMISLRNKVVVERELTNAKLNFFTKISHELRTPLTLILGPVNELNSQEQLSEKGRVYLSLIEQNARRLLRLVNQLLDFRKIQGSKMELNLNEVHLKTFIHEVCSNFVELVREKNILFEVSCETGDEKVWLDKEKMDGVVFNILSNAFKFTPEKGFVEVRVIISVEEEKQLTIEISDNGPGIPKDKERELFKVFTSGLTDNVTKQEGTGIGLALSKELVRLHNGELNYKPTPGGGATFVIQLDTCLQPGSVKVNIDEKFSEEDQENLLHSTADGALIEAGKKHPEFLILIAEDNPDLRHFLRLQLDGDYRIEEAVNGRDGLSKAVKLQ
ncbi:MAG: hypothetical protein JW798_07310, partial [Prolixibacteraceae bacterium]|nr:hypothetical protein [Prolixibacteraceae bacterium]